MPQRNKYFIFVDETWNNDQEQFFGLWLLIVPWEIIGELYNILDRNYQKIKNLSNLRMLERINNHYIAGEYEDVLKYAKSLNNFELKFKNINKENFSLYIQTVKECLTLSGLHFSSIVFDKQESWYNKEWISHWDRYLNNLAMLVVNNMNKFPENSDFVILADQISQPKTEWLTYEASLYNKICKRMIDKSMKQTIFGITRIESHSAPFVQLVDLLVWAVVYDFYDHEKIRKEEFLRELRTLFSVSSFNANVTKNSPAYFSVWKYKKP